MVVDAFERLAAEHAAGRITRPLRHNGQSSSGIKRDLSLNVCVRRAKERGRGGAGPIEISYHDKQLILLAEVVSLWHGTGTFSAR
jgi:hypothetical protein